MTETGNFLYLSEDTLEGLGVTWPESVAAIERLIEGHAQGKVWYALPPQPVNATHALNLSAGVSNSNVLRGLSFS